MLSEKVRPPMPALQLGEQRHDVGGAVGRDAQMARVTRCGRR